MSHADTQSPSNAATDMVRGEDDLRVFKLLLGLSFMLSAGIGILAIWLGWRISGAITAELAS